MLLFVFFNVAVQPVVLDRVGKIEGSHKHGNQGPDPGDAVFIGIMNGEPGEKDAHDSI